MKRILSKADALRGSVILPTDVVMGYQPLRTAPLHSQAILKRPEGKLFANNAVPLGRGLTLSTANRGLVPPASSPNVTLTSWLRES